MLCGLDPSIADLHHGQPDCSRSPLVAAVLVSISLCAVLIMSFSVRPVQALYGLMPGKPKTPDVPESEQA
jgi:hypothetical protein